MMTITTIRISTQSAIPSPVIKSPPFGHVPTQFFPSSSLSFSRLAVMHSRTLTMIGIKTKNDQTKNARQLSNGPAPLMATIMHANKQRIKKPILFPPFRKSSVSRFLISQTALCPTGYAPCLSLRSAAESGFPAGKNERCPDPCKSTR